MADRKHDAEQIKIDAANAAAGICPETGRDLSKCDGATIRNHAREIFPRGDDTTIANSDYSRRYRLLTQMADARDAARVK